MNITTTALAYLFVLVPAFAVTPVIEENFDLDTANWKDNLSMDLTFVASGGVEGSSYVTTVFSFNGLMEDDGPAIFRGQDEFNFSGNAFVGDWVTGGVTEFTAYVRHDAPVPLSYFVRFSTPGNFPGAIGVEPVPVQPNSWTEIKVDINALNPFIIYEGPPNFTGVFGNLGHIQVGVSAPASLVENPASFSFDLDRVRAVPEPESIALLFLSAFLAVVRRYRFAA